jgi:DHA1 family inner membrane transport protein
MQENAPMGVGRESTKTALSGQQLPSALVIGSTGTLILGLQPVLLGALLSENRVTFDGLALMATVEMLAIGIGSALLALLFSARHMRLKAIVLLLGTALGNYLTAGADGATSLTIIRGVTGLLEGGLIAIAVELIARSATPGRHGGWFVILQTLAQCILAAILALIVVPKFGSAGGFHLLAAASLLPLLAVPMLLDDYGSLPKPAESAGKAAGWGKPAIALLVVFTLYLFIGAIWAFLEPIGGQNGIDAATVGIIVAASLLVQVCGAMSATFLEPHLRFPIVIGGAAFAAVLISLGFASGPSVTLFWVLSLATGFLWLFVVPWQIAMAVEIDPSRKSTLLVPAAQLFGAAIGPAGAAAFIQADNFRPVTWFAAGCAFVSLLLLLGLVLASRRGKELTA